MIWLENGFIDSEKVCKWSLPIPWQLGSCLWSRDKAVIGEREACGEGAGFSPQMRESLPSPGVWKHHQLSRMLLK